jgi:hypothetical protein
VSIECVCMKDEFAFKHSGRSKNRQILESERPLDSDKFSHQIFKIAEF